MASRIGPGALRVALILGALLAIVLGFIMWGTRMPGESHRGPLPPPTAAELELAAELERVVRHLALEIGPRDPLRPAAVARAAAWIEGELEGAGFTVERHEYTVGGRTEVNLIAELPGMPGAGSAGGGSAGEIVVVGAHYDTAIGTPGANDNATGVAALLSLARSLAGRRLPRTVRLVAFATEEPPYFDTPDMGSRHYARLCRERGDDIVAMLSLETLGYYTDEPKSQAYPPLVGSFYPDRGDFVAVVGDLRSRSLVRRAVREFRRSVPFPCEGGALPAFLPGVGWSDHASFWREGYRAVMWTDTALYRDPAYHLADDLPGRLAYPRMARVVAGILAVTLELAGAPEE